MACDVKSVENPSESLFQPSFCENVETVSDGKKNTRLKVEQIHGRTKEGAFRNKYRVNNVKKSFSQL